MLYLYTESFIHLQNHFLIRATQGANSSDTEVVLVLIVWPVAIGNMRKVSVEAPFDHENREICTI